MKTSIVKKIAYIAAAMTMAVSATACGSTDSGSAIRSYDGLFHFPVKQL